MVDDNPWRNAGDQTILPWFEKILLMHNHCTQGMPSSNAIEVEHIHCFRTSPRFQLLRKRPHKKVRKFGLKFAPFMEGLPSCHYMFYCTLLMQSRLGRARSKPASEASRLDEAWPRPRLGRKTHWHKDKARLTGTRNYMILLLKPSQAELEVVGNCAASLEEFEAAPVQRDGLQASLEA